jgi:site-specific DNA recombinase
MQDKNKVRAAGYCRVSTKGQAEEGFNLAEYERKVRADAKRLGEKWTRAYVDAGLSGRTTEKRIELNLMLADADAGEFDVLVIPALDRLGRNTRDLLDILARLEKAGVAVRSLRGDVDTSTAAGKLTTTIFSGLSEFESNVIGERTRSGLRGSATETGLPPCGQPPHGYRQIGKKKGRKWLVDEKWEWLVHRIDGEYLAGSGANGIARRLNDEAVLTRNGGRWSARVVLDIIKNPAYAGIVRHNGEEFTASFEPIRTRATWQAIREQLAAREALHGKGRGRDPVGSHLLVKGLARCQHCGRAMTPCTNRRTGYEYYRCGNRTADGTTECSGWTVSRAKVDEPLLRQFEEEWHDRSGTLAAINEHAERKIAEARAQVEDAELQAARAEAGRERADRAFLYSDDPISEESYNRLIAKATADGEGARAEADQMRAQLAEVEAEVATLNAEKEMAERLDALRQAIAGWIDSADGDIDALRAAFLATFKVIWFDLEDGQLMLTAILRDEAITGYLHPGDPKLHPERLTRHVAEDGHEATFFQGEPVVRRAALHLGKEMKPNAPSPPGTRGRRGRRLRTRARRRAGAPRPRPSAARGRQAHA